MFRHIPADELQDACRRINPNDPTLSSKAKNLMDQGPSFTLAMAIVKIANDQGEQDAAPPRKPPGLSPAPPQPAQHRSG
jgi:hypothetical protein